MKKIAVIGSCSMDLTVSAKRRPHSGETIIGDSFFAAPGGKGANQAVACARLGAEVFLIGCVGTDSFGDQIIANFEKNGVDTTYIERTPRIPSGTAHITIEPDGTNSIIVVQGANAMVSPHQIDRAQEMLQQVDFVLTQQEIPEETVYYVADLCSHQSLPLLLNPAPARPLSTSLLEKVSYLTPNEHECLFLSEGKETAEWLMRYPCKAFLTEGEKGVSYWNGKKKVTIPSFNVPAQDTTGAGDTFSGALAVALAEGRELDEGLRFANAAAALSVTQYGAQGGIPTRVQVENFLEDIFSPPFQK